MFTGVYRVICNICRDFPAICKYYRVFPADIAEKTLNHPVNICSVVRRKILYLNFWCFRKSLQLQMLLISIYNGKTPWFPIPKWYSDFGDPVIKGYCLWARCYQKLGQKSFWNSIWTNSSSIYFNPYKTEKFFFTHQRNWIENPKHNFVILARLICTLRSD